MKHLVSGLILGVLLFATQSWAGETQPPPSTEQQETGHEYTWEPMRRPPPRGPGNRWEIAPEVSWFFYEEPSVSVEWTGILYGARASFTERSRTNHLKGRLEGHYVRGGVDYDGFLSDGTPHTDSGTDWIFESRTLLGYDWSLGKNVITPFMGLGYRYWFDDLESASAYRRRVRYLYSPIGIESNYPVNESWSFGLRAEYDLFWRGWVRSHLKDVNSSFNNVDNRQETGYGARGSVYLKRVVNQRYSVSIEPFIRYWDINDSDTSPLTFSGVLIGSGREPANRTIESGLQISFVF